MTGVQCDYSASLSTLEVAAVTARTITVGLNARTPLFPSPRPFRGADHW